MSENLIPAKNFRILHEYLPKISQNIQIFFKIFDGVSPKILKFRHESRFPNMLLI